MNQRWSFYDLTTGEFVGREFSAPRGEEIELPAGCGAIEGSYDRLSKRVDLQSGNVVDWVNQELIDAVTRRERVSAAKARLAELDRMTLRPLLEDRLRPTERGDDGKLPSDRLQAIEDEKATLRALINAETDTSAP